MDKEAKEETIKLIPATIFDPKNPFLCLLLTKEQLADIEQCIKVCNKKRDISLKTTRKQRGSDESVKLPNRTRIFHIDNTFSLAGPSIVINNKVINRAAMIDYLGKCMQYWLDTPSLHPSDQINVKTVDTSFIQGVPKGDSDQKDISRNSIA